MESGKLTLQDRPGIAIALANGSRVEKQEIASPSEYGALPL
jgi:hypothetical protein